MVRRSRVHDGDDTPPRVALLCESGEDPDGWSGIPQGLADGFRARGVEAVRVPLEPHPALGVPLHALAKGRWRHAAIARRSGPEALGRTLAIAARLRRLGPLLGTVAMTTQLYRLPAGVEAVVLVDMTLQQAAESPGSTLVRSGVAARHVDRWIARQAETCRRARACCAASSWAAASLVADYGVPEERVHVVGFGRNVDPLDLPRDWSTPRYLFVGGDWVRKGGDVLLEAFRRVRASEPAATLEVVGDHPPLTADGVRGHGRLRISDSADREHLRRLYAGATCFVLPSRFEAFGIAYLEAAAAGLPCIGTTVGGGASALGAALTLVAPDDVDALTRAMQAYADPARAAAAGAAAQAAGADYTWTAVAGRVLAAMGAAPGSQPRARELVG